MRVLQTALACLSAGILTLGTVAAAQSFADLAQNDSPARHQKLVEAAKKEGSLTFYTSIAEKDGPVLAEDFEKRYGIKVKIWRASTAKVLQRVIVESQANRWDFDAVDISAPEMEALYREKTLQEVKSSFHADLFPEAMPAHRGWAPQFLSVFVQAYNTKEIKKADLPKSYNDLLDPKWKGKLGVEAKDNEWYCGLMKHLGEDKGGKLFKDIVSKNGWSVRTGHSLLNNMVVSGEVPLGLTVYSYMTEQAKQKGAPVDWFTIDPVIGRANGIAVSKKPPHPNAALLFYEYMISDAQPLIIKMNYLSPSKKVESPLKGVNIRYIDPAATLDDIERCTKSFEELLKIR
jgi:iron(III) transport system substrate-binding protein